MALTRRERAELERLQAKDGNRATRRARERRPRDDEEDDDSGVYVLRGRHADGFLHRMFGTDDDGSDSGDDQGEDEDDEDEDEDDELVEDEKPPPGNRFFRSKR
jgi:hypothetical protein